MDDWKQNLLTDDAAIGGLLREARRVAVLGVKTEAQADQAAFYVATYVADHGAEVGRPVYRKVADVPGSVDIVDVFRRPTDIPAHLPDLLAKKPRAVWFQLGIRNDAAAETLARAGIQVVQDRCLMVEWRRHRG